nr:putative metal-binding motif-containing protein [Myxococcota bacterium]MDQ3178739.1 putative metal-binding motif-containing protein [Actinomycetota bacterium]
QAPDDAAEPDAAEPDAATLDAATLDGCTAASFWRDADGDGHGDPASMMTACEAPAGHVANDDDCDDDCAACFPGATELCDGVDQDCDASLDEGLPDMTSYADVDRDGHGDPATAETGCGIPADRVAIGDDCDDAAAATYPGATEACNTFDDDCDDVIDEGVRDTFYRDADGDGYGVTSMSTEACSTPAGYATMPGDCNDVAGAGGASDFPGGTEVCDGRDNDCDGTPDDGVLTRWYRDCDNDSFAATTMHSYEACAAVAGSPSGCAGGRWTSREPDLGTTDCDDFDAAHFPGNTAWYSVYGDFDCSGMVDPRYTTVAGPLPCAPITFMGTTTCSAVPGWTDGSVPRCGVSESYTTCSSSCSAVTAPRTQQCH